MSSWYIPVGRLVAVALSTCVSCTACVSEETTTAATENVRRTAATSSVSTATASATDDIPRPAPAAARDHCAAGEDVVFSCRIEGSNRIVSLCTTAAARTRGESAPRYLEGPAGDPDVVLVHGTPPDVPAQFQRTPLGFAGGTGGYAFSIDRGDEVRVIYSISGSERLERQGVMRTDTNVERVLSDDTCEPTSVVESDRADVLRTVRAWPAHPRLESSGLPPVGR